MKPLFLALVLVAAVAIGQASELKEKFDNTADTVLDRLRKTRTNLDIVLNRAETIIDRAPESRLFAWKSAIKAALAENGRTEAPECPYEDSLNDVAKKIQDATRDCLTTTVNKLRLLWSQLDDYSAKLKDYTADAEQEDDFCSNKDNPSCNPDKLKFLVLNVQQLGIEVVRSTLKAKEPLTTVLKEGVKCKDSANFRFKDDGQAVVDSTVACISSLD